MTNVICDRCNARITRTDGHYYVHCESEAQMLQTFQNKADSIKADLCSTCRDKLVEFLVKPIIERARKAAE